MFSLETATQEEIELVKQLEARAVYLLSMREHGSKELKRKLREKFPETENRPSLVDFVILTCQKNGWLSDDRFIEVSVRQGMEKGHGPYKIRQTLQQRTDASDLIEQYLALEDSDWVDIAQEALEKKFGDAFKPKEMKEQARRMRFLQGRGFSQSQIWKAMK